MGVALVHTKGQCSFLSPHKTLVAAQCGVKKLENSIPPLELKYSFFIILRIELHIKVFLCCTSQNLTVVIWGTLYRSPNCSDEIVITRLHHLQIARNIFSVCDFVLRV